MRRWLFPLFALFTAALAALVIWLWATDAVLIHKCTAAGGLWDAPTRTCQLSPDPAAPVSRSV